MNEALRTDRPLAPDAVAARILRSGGDRGAVATLVRRALSDDAAATRALFGGVVEPLCDAFTARGARIREAILAQAIDLALRAPGARALDRALLSEGIGCEADVLRRARWGVAPRPPAAARLRRVIVLSRVTLGADLAVNGALLPALSAGFPGAEIVLVGPGIARPVAEGVGARLKVVEHARRGALTQRLSEGLHLRDVLRGEAAGLRPGEWLPVDSDARLTQLGVLAPGPEAAYRRLPSREIGGPGTLAEIARAWARHSLGIGPALLPLRPEDAAWSRRLRAALRRDARRVVAVGFSKGGDPAKRVGRALRKGSSERCSPGATGYCCRAGSMPGSAPPRANCATGWLRTACGWRTCRRAGTSTE